MQEQLLTQIRQARLHLQRGNVRAATELLENARALARGDRALLKHILPDLADCYDAEARSEDAYLLRCHLAEIQGQPAPAPGGRTTPAVRVGTRRRAWWMAGGILAGVILVGAITVALVIGYQRAGRRYAAVQDDWADRVGLLIRVGRYAGEFGGKNVIAEVPLSCGTCIAVHPRGLVIAPQVLLADDSANPPPSQIPGLPELTLRDTGIRIRFGPEGSRFATGQIVRPLADTELVVIQLDRTFQRVSRLSEFPPEAGQETWAVGYVAGVSGLGPGCVPDQVASLLQRLLLRSDHVRLEDWLGLHAIACARVKGTLLLGGQAGADTPQIAFEGILGAAPIGVPLVNEFDSVVGIVVTPPAAGEQNTVARPVQRFARAFE